jgi:putative SOS response-associated peptidase YedK
MTWHWFALKGDEPRPLFAFPGVWTRYTGPTRKGGKKVDLEVFAFITTEPNELTVSINHERMPVLLSDPADFETWLSGSTEEAFKLARAYAAEEMRIVQSGSERKDLLAA